MNHKITKKHYNMLWRMAGVGGDMWARLRAGCDKYIDTVKFTNNLKEL